MFVHPDQTDYSKLSTSELMAACQDYAARWALAFLHVAPLESLDADWLTRWFSMMIEHSADVRRARAAERGPRKGDR